MAVLAAVVAASVNGIFTLIAGFLIAREARKAARLLAEQREKEKQLTKGQ